MLDGRERIDALQRGFDTETVRMGGEGEMPCVDVETREARYGEPGEEPTLVPLGALWVTDLYERYRSILNRDRAATKAERERRLETLEDVAATTNEYMVPVITLTGCGQAEAREAAQALQMDPWRMWRL